MLAVVIPSLDGAAPPGLLTDLESQTMPPAQIEVVSGVRPSGRARNEGAGRVRAEVLVFLDADVRLGGPEVLERLVLALRREPTLGMVGSAQQLPPDSNGFQRACARQLPRMICPVVAVLTDSDMATTACCAIPRKVFEELGGFDPDIPRGVDPEFRHRLRLRGYRVAVAPGAVHYHPPPAGPWELARTAFRNGRAAAVVARLSPEAVLDTPDGHVGSFAPRTELQGRLARKARALLLALRQGAFLRLGYELAYLAGYGAGILART